MKLSTNAGFNAYAVLVPAMAVIESMPPGRAKEVLLGLVVVCLAFVGYITHGSGITPEQGKEIIDAHEEIQKVLEEGRK
jgi:hypothetical protein